MVCTRPHSTDRPRDTSEKTLRDPLMHRGFFCQILLKVSLDITLQKHKLKICFCGSWNIHVDINLQSRRTRYLRIGVFCGVLSSACVRTLHTDIGEVVYQALKLWNRLLPLNIVYNALCRFVLGGTFITHYFTTFEIL